MRPRAFLVFVAIIALLAVLAAPLGHADSEPAEPLQGPDDWPMYGASAAHAFSNDANPPSVMGRVWEFAGNGSLGVAVSSDGFAYFGDVDTVAPPAGPHLVLHKVVTANKSTETAADAWGVRSMVDRIVLGAPHSLAVANGIVYALATATLPSGYQEVLVAHNAASGAELWRFDATSSWNSTTSAPTRSAPVVGAGVVVFGSQDGNVSAVFAGNGTASWRYAVGAPVNTVPTISGSFVYATAGTSLYFLDAQGFRNGDQGVVDFAGDATLGDLLQVVDVGAPTTASPVVADPYVYVDAGGTLWAFDRTLGGAPVWGASTGGTAAGTPAVLGNDILVRRADGRVIAHDRTTGALLWATPGLAPGAMGGDMAASSAGDGRIFLSVSGGDLVVLDASDGAVVQRVTLTGGTPQGAPVLAGGQALVARGSRLHAVRGVPDLSIVSRDVDFRSASPGGDVVRGNITLTVRNVGDEPVAGVTVRVYDGATAPENLIGTFTIGAAANPLEGGRAATVFTDDRDWSVGRHDVTVVIDAAPTELELDNNSVAAAIYVQAGPPPPPTVVGGEPYWVALLVGFLAGAAILFFPIRRLRAMRRREKEEPKA